MGVGLHAGPVSTAGRKIAKVTFLDYELLDLLVTLAMIAGVGLGYVVGTSRQTHKRQHCTHAWLYHRACVKCGLKEQTRAGH
jgi:hypothetical protein